MEASSGSVVIEGHSVRSGMEGMSGLVGICPQHDLLWESLTGREHLLFYARLHALKVHHMQLVNADSYTLYTIASSSSLFEEIPKKKKKKLIIMQVQMKCLCRSHIDLNLSHAAHDSDCAISQSAVRQCPETSVIQERLQSFPDRIPGYEDNWHDVE